MAPHMHSQRTSCLVSATESVRRTGGDFGGEYFRSLPDCTYMDISTNSQVDFILDLDELPLVERHSLCFHLYADDTQI